MKTIVTIPTYNERHNIEKLTEEILGLKLNLEILVVDDNSPDGTWQIVKDISRRDPFVHLLLRTKRCNRGSAGIDGFKEALRLGADYIIEMDADLSHDPKVIPAMLKEIENYDLILGSRVAEGGRDSDRSILRRFVSFLARRYVRRLLQISIGDVSSGFRCFRRKVLENIDLDDMISAGPSIVLEILYRTCLKGFKIKEIPITFRERKEDRSKLDYVTLLESLVMVLRLRKMHKDGRL